MGKKYKRKPVEEDFSEKFDPLNVLPLDILNIIFGNLDVKNLMNASLVSRNWNNFIGSSECIKRINVVFKYGKSDEIMNSNRQYQNITIKEPRYGSTRIAAEKEIKTFLQKFSSSVKLIDTGMDIQRCCELPKLKKLNCTMSDRRNFYSTGLLSKLDMIEDLTMRNYNWNEQSIKVYKDSLTSATNLKVLRTQFFPFLKECKFALRELRCIEIKEHECSELIEFLKMNSETLEVLDIHLPNESDHANDILSTILAMPNLNKLDLCTWFPATINVCLPINKTIKYLRLHGSNFPNIMAFLEQLQVLKAYDLDGTLLQYILSCPSLRKVKYLYVDKNVPADFSISAQYAHIQFIKV